MTLVDEHPTGELPVVKSRVGWVGEPQHTRPPGWPGPEADWAQLAEQFLRERLARFTFNAEQPVTGPRHRPRKGQS